MPYDRLALTRPISYKAKKLFGSGNMGQNNWGVPLSDGLDTRPGKILDSRLSSVCPTSLGGFAAERAPCRQEISVDSGGALQHGAQQQMRAVPL